VLVYVLVGLGFPALYWLARDRWIGAQERTGQAIKNLMPFLPDPVDTERQRHLRLAFDVFWTVCWIGLVTAGYVA
jgi:hypothetical protein